VTFGDDLGGIAQSFEVIMKLRVIFLEPNASLFCIPRQPGNCRGVQQMYRHPFVNK